MRNSQKHFFEKNKTTVFVTVVSILILIVNICGCFPAFVTFYTGKIYPALAGSIARCTSPLPVALGEIFIFFAVFALLLWVVLSVLLFWEKGKKYRRFYRLYMKCLLCITLSVGLLYSVCYIVPLRSRPLYDSVVKRTDYTIEDLQELRQMITKKTNAAAEEVPRDEDGKIVFPRDCEQAVAKAVKKVSGQYPQLKGFCPRGKAAMTSDLLDWMGIGGFTYPFSMEVQVNRYTANLYYPTLYSHELCHHFGYYTEGDATFLSTVICTASDLPVLRYCGYLEMYNYVNREYKASLKKIFGADREKLIYRDSAALSKRVKRDILDAHNEYLALYQKKVNKVLEKTVSDTVTKISDDGWEIHADLLQQYNYDGIVLMLLNYYENADLQ